MYKSNSSLMKLLTKHVVKGDSWKAVRVIGGGITSVRFVFTAGSNWTDEFC